MVNTTVRFTSQCRVTPGEKCGYLRLLDQHVSQDAEAAYNWVCLSFLFIMAARSKILDPQLAQAHCY
jgi:hypothetical protein